MNAFRPATFCLTWFLALAAAPSPGATQGDYLVLTATHSQRPPFAAVRLTCDATLRWWEIQIYDATDFVGKPSLALRLLTTGSLLTNAVSIERYLLQVPATGELLEYQNIHTGRALLPPWAEFEHYFLPRPASGTSWQAGLPETCLFLGHVLTLQQIRTNTSWQDWPEPRRLSLDPELLIGTSRPFRDREGARLPQQPQRKNYTYVPFTEEDYHLMIQTGFNLFTIKPDQEKWVRAEPVFYIRSTGGDPPLRYPADLYRANYLGPVMFMDEPSILMVGDTNVHRILKYFSDAAALIEMRTHLTYESSGSYGAWSLEKALLGRGLNLGDLRLKQPDFPSWETLYDTAFYQMKGGGMGIVHEGRYRLPEFDQAVARFTGQPRRHTAEELLQYHYAFLRGGARPFHKWWGTAIYGQCDTNLAPLALTLAYDMGARYLWFWTSDHDHHVPWPEQLAWVRHLRAHARDHPRPSIFAQTAPVDVAIVIPYGYFLSLDNLWWVRVLDKEGRNDASQKYRRLMQRALAAVHDCFTQRLNFDITVDDGRPITGYRKLIRISDAD